MKTTTTINPATGQAVKTWTLHTDEQAIASVAEAAAEFLRWREISFQERAKPLKRCAELLRERKDVLAKLMAEEMGKPIRQGLSEAEKCAWVCEFYAENAAKFLEPENIKTEASKSYVSFDPLGVILAIMPWNFPLWQFYRFAAPSLMAGNTIILKHAVNTSGSSMAIGELMRDAGYPAGAVIPLLINHEQVKDLMQLPAIQGVTLTGSTRAGKAIGSVAGSVMKKAVLELGGADPYIVLADADLKTAVDCCTASRLINSGQSCIAAKRFIVVKSMLKEFEEGFVKALSLKKVGDPMDMTTDVGPMARADLRDELHEQVQQSIASGARCLLGGKKPVGPGAYYPVTVLTNVKKGMPAFDDELFGPAAAIIAAEDEEDAIRLANDSIYGLGAAVFTRDTARGEHIAQHRIQAGCVFVNDFVKSDPRLPFGGIKESGYGRELGCAGIREFVNMKTVVVK